jgi:hypothetical protein
MRGEQGQASQEVQGPAEKFLGEVAPKNYRLATPRELTLLCQFLNYRYRVPGAVSKVLANYSREQLKKLLGNKECY